MTTTHGAPPGRDHSLDVFKGLLVLLMVYCHVIQFFGDQQLFPIEALFEQIINLAVFPGFVFAFGAAISMAYLGKAPGEVCPRMVRSALRSLGAFYLSGIAFRVLREGKPFAMNTVRGILFLQDIPGWSEFLLAFAVYGVLAIACFVPLRWLRTRPLAAAGISLLCLAGTFLPYGSITSPHLGILIGTRSYVTFPALQYAPYFLLGIAWPGRNTKYTWVWAVGAALGSGVGVLLSLQNGGFSLPERFPPSLGWVLLPAGMSAALLALAWGLCTLLRRRPPLPILLRPLSAMGRSSLLYLLASNLVIFTCAGRNILPWVKNGRHGLWGQPIQSPVGALCWTLVLLAAIGFVASLVTRPAPFVGTKEAAK